jgi:SAM-dependent methyltransferase
MSFSTAERVADMIELEQAVAQPLNGFDGLRTAHLTHARISLIPEAGAGDDALDLGCCDAAHRPILQALGYRYCGLDIVSRGATVLGDAHALPFPGECFGLVLSVSVLQYLSEPLRALREVTRVLRPGGWFVGSVAFLEPWDRDSLFHFTPRGLAQAMQGAGLQLERIVVDPNWNVLRAQLQMGPLRRLPSAFSGALAAPFGWLVRGHAWCGRLLSSDPAHHSAAAALACHAGSLFFVARRTDGSDRNP